jgi:diacylglycerol kinase
MEPHPPTTTTAPRPAPPERGADVELLNDKPFSFTNRLQSIGWAAKGFIYFTTRTHAFWIQSVVVLSTFAVAATRQLTSGEWATLVLAGGLIFVAEALNTAVELVVDLVTREYHPLAGKAKDVSAGAVMVAALVAFAVTLVILVPKFV